MVCDNGGRLTAFGPLARPLVVGRLGATDALATTKYESVRDGGGENAGATNLLPFQSLVVRLPQLCGHHHVCSSQQELQALRQAQQVFQVLVVPMEDVVQCSVDRRQ